MIISRLRDSLDPIADADIDMLECKLGATLPDEYRRFLLATNGGHLGIYFIFPVADSETYRGPYASISHFLGISSDYQECDLWNYRQDFNHIILPPELVIVAHSEFGDEICLGIDGQCRGEIWILNIDRSDQLELCFAAEDFHSMIGSIQVDYEALPNVDPWFAAIEVGDDVALLKYLDEWRDVDTPRDEFGMTLLMKAAGLGWPKCVKLLLQRGADVNARDSIGRDSLMLAATHHHYDATKILLAHGANPNVRDDASIPLLRQTLSRDPNQGRLPDLRIARLLIEQGADPDDLGADVKSLRDLAVPCHEWDLVLNAAKFRSESK